VQLEPLEPVLKAPGTIRLKLKHDAPLSNFAFIFNLRHYTLVSTQGDPPNQAFVSQAVVDVHGWSLHSFPFQLNFSSSVHRITQIN
jgi:hypothetical protein